MPDFKLNLNPGGFIGFVIGLGFVLAYFLLLLGGEWPRGPWKLCLLGGVFGAFMGNAIWSVYIAKKDPVEDNDESRG